MTPSRRMRRTGQFGGGERIGARRNAMRHHGSCPPDANFRAANDFRATPKVTQRTHSGPGTSPLAAKSGCSASNFDRLFLTLLCTIRRLSEESLAPPSRGANAFWGLRAVRCGYLRRVHRVGHVGARLHMPMLHLPMRANRVNRAHSQGASATLGVHSVDRRVACGIAML